MISYKPLRKLLIDKDMSCGELKDILQISSATMAKLNSDKMVSLTVFDILSIEYNKADINI